MRIVRVVCWDTIAAPGPKIDAQFAFDDLPRVGEQLDVEGGQVQGGADGRLGGWDGILYVHKVRHAYEEGSFRTFVEVTDRREAIS